MILTITANPSVDISYQLDRLKLDGVTRTSQVKKDAGGKGIHVAFALKSQGAEVVNSGFVGGKLGEFIEESLEKKGLKSSFVKIEGETRNCIAILHEGKQTEILEKGPVISKEDEENFLKALPEIAKDCDIINISGSLPQGLDPSFYKKIISYGKRAGKFVSVDTSGKSLEEVVRAEEKPDLIKPNETEIAQVLGKDLESDQDLKEALSQEPFSKIPYIFLSQGAGGALVKIKDKFYKARVPKVDAVNPVGSGDSSLAGALYGIENKESDQEIIKRSMTCGVLNVLTEEIAILDMGQFDKYYEKIKVEEI